MKESEKIEKYLDSASELKIQWKMQMTVIKIIVSALVTVLNDTEWDRTFGNQRMNQDPPHDSVFFFGGGADYAEESWRPELTCCHSEWSPTNAGMKNSQLA